MTTYLYFFHAAPYRIKIGVSSNVNRRLRDVGLHLPEMPVLIGAVEGGYALEKHVHGLLGEHRLNGEWFDDCPKVRTVMTRLLEGGPGAINFKPRPKAERTPFTPQVKTPEEFAAMYKRLAALMWPDDPVGGFAELSEADLSQAAAWLDGAEEIPKLVRAAMAIAVVTHALSIEIPVSAARSITSPSVLGITS